VSKFVGDPARRNSSEYGHLIADTVGVGPGHILKGLTARMVLIATGTTTALFRALVAADLPVHGDPQHDYVPLVVYNLQDQSEGTTVSHSNPNTTYVAFARDAVGSSAVRATVAYDTITYTHCRFVALAEGNEAGTGKGLRFNIGATAVEATWDGTGASVRDSGWIAITSPGGVVNEDLEVKGSSATEDITLYTLVLMFKRDT